MENENTADTNITLQDMVTIVNIIDVCSERGAFKGNELLAVGKTREKIAAFLKLHQKTEDETAGEITPDEIMEGAE
jgi:hypothetical protein